VSADHFEEAADEAAGCPVRHGDAATGTHHPKHLARGAAVVGREHDAERGQHDVEGTVNLPLSSAAMRC
jgi:hypothetical protein